MAQNTDNINALLCEYVEGTLDDAQRAEVEQQLQGNPRHRQLLDELKQASQVIQALPRAKAPPEIIEAVTAHLERSALLDPVEPAPRVLRMSLWPRVWSAAAVVALAMGVAGGIYLALPGASPFSAHREIAIDTPSLLTDTRGGRAAPARSITDDTSAAGPGARVADEGRDVNPGKSGPGGLAKESDASRDAGDGGSAKAAGTLGAAEAAKLGGGAGFNWDGDAIAQGDGWIESGRGNNRLVFSGQSLDLDAELAQAPQQLVIVVDAPRLSLANNRINDYLASNGIAFDEKPIASSANAPAPGGGGQLQNKALSDRAKVDAAGGDGASTGSTGTAAPRDGTPPGDTPKGDTPKGDTPVGDKPKDFTPDTDARQNDRARQDDTARQTNATPEPAAGAAGANATGAPARVEQQAVAGQVGAPAAPVAPGVAVAPATRPAVARVTIDGNLDGNLYVARRMSLRQTDELAQLLTREQSAKRAELLSLEVRPAAAAKAEDTQPPTTQMAANVAGEPEREAPPPRDGFRRDAIAVNDQLEIRLTADADGKAAEVASTVEVDRAGRISLPEIGELQAAGATEAELTTALNELLGQQNLKQRARVSRLAMDQQGQGQARPTQGWSASQAADPEAGRERGAQQAEAVQRSQTYQQALPPAAQRQQVGLDRRALRDAQFDVLILVRQRNGEAKPAAANEAEQQLNLTPEDDPARRR